MSKIDLYKDKLEKTVVKLKEFDSNKLDENYEVLKEAFDLCYENEVFKLYDIESKLLDSFRLEFYENITSLSGVLSFLAIQLFAANAIMRKNNFHKKEIYFEKKCGIAINHLRSEHTVVSAIKCDGGYKLSGTLTWCSGYKIFDTLLIGFHFEDNECEVMAPFIEQKGFKIGSADETFVGFGLNTVNVELDNYFVKEEEIVSFNEKGNYTKNKSISKTVHMCLYGLGFGVIKEIEDKELKEYASIKLSRLKNSFMNSNDADEMDSIRVELYEFILNLLGTAMALKGGTSVLCNSNYQRYYKELIMFNANGLNQKLKNLSKDRFLKR